MQQKDGTAALVYHTRENALADAPGGGEDWSGWERWLRPHLKRERALVLETIAEAISERDQRTKELEQRVAELTGECRVLRALLVEKGSRP
jgi:hypothetical protein